MTIDGILTHLPHTFLCWSSRSTMLSQVHRAKGVRESKAVDEQN
jgi:hypothetical protein